MNAVVAIVATNAPTAAVLSREGSAYQAPAGARPYCALVAHDGRYIFHVSSNHAANEHVLSYQAQLRVRGISYDIQQHLLLDEIAALSGERASEIGESDLNTMRAYGRTLFASAARARASDLLFYISQNQGQIKHRILGSEAPVAAAFGTSVEPSNFANAFIRAIFNGMVAGSKTSYSDRFPVDGVINNPALLPTDVTSIRVSTLPSTPVSKVAFRLHYKLPAKSLKDLGFSPDAVQVLRQMANKRGLLLFTGPIGSGKTTSEHYYLQLLTQLLHGCAFVSVQQPVEIASDDYLVVDITGQTPEEIDDAYTRTITGLLRQANDIVSLGEIRTPEAARAALRLATTGQIILGTMHAETAFHATNSLAALAGQDAFRLFASDSLLGIVSQRLIPVLCSACKVECTHDDLTALGLPLHHQLYQSTELFPTKTKRHMLYRRVFSADTALACPACAGQGVTHRRVIADVIPLDATLRTILFDESPNAARHALAMWANRNPNPKTNSMYESAMSGILAGEFDPASVLRALGSLDSPALDVLTTGGRGAHE